MSNSKIYLEKYSVWINLITGLVSVIALIVVICLTKKQIKSDKNLQLSLKFAELVSNNQATEYKCKNGLKIWFSEKISFNLILNKIEEDLAICRDGLNNLQTQAVLYRAWSKDDSIEESQNDRYVILQIQVTEMLKLVADSRVSENKNSQEFLISLLNARDIFICDKKLNLERENCAPASYLKVSTDHNQRIIKYIEKAL